MKKCSKCKQVRLTSQFNKNRKSRDGLTCYCKICVAKLSKESVARRKDEVRAYQREYHKLHRSMLTARDRDNKRNRHKRRYLADEEYTKKVRVRSATAGYIKNHKIVRGKCLFCESINTLAHHEDYDKPFEIVWVCSQHHSDIHRGKLKVKAELVNLKVS